MTNDALYRQLAQTPLALYRPALERALKQFELPADSHSHDPGATEAETPEAALRRRTGSSAMKRGAIGVVPVYGVIRQRGPEDFMDLLFGGSGASTDAIAQTLRQMAADPDISTIIMDIDSPGGTVYGVQELGDEIARLTEDTRIVAVANAQAFSAAYWIASQASELVVTPSGEVGSIGVWTMHIDWSDWNQQKGLDITYISAGKYKVAGNEDEPLSDDAQQLIQDDINRYYSDFVGAVARGRKVRPADVRKGFGEGWTVGAKAAVQEGMADLVATFADTLRRFGASMEPDADDRAAAERPSPQAEIEIERERAAVAEELA